MDILLKLKHAVAELLNADKKVETAQTKEIRRVAEHNRGVARLNLIKAEKRLRRASRQKKLRDLGLYQ